MALRVQGRRLDPATESPEARPLPRAGAPSRPPFLFGTLPKRWDWDDMLGRFLPQVLRISFSPGVQGTKALRNGPDGRQQMDTSAARASFERKGGTLINPADRRLGPYARYQQMLVNDAGAEVHASIFETADVVGEDVFWADNPEEFRRFRQLLLDEEIVPAMHERVHAIKVSAQEVVVAELQQRYGAQPAHGGLRTELETAVGRLRAMRDGIPTADALALIRAESEGVEPSDVDATPGKKATHSRRKVMGPKP